MAGNKFSQPKNGKSHSPQEATDWAKEKEILLNELDALASRFPNAREGDVSSANKFDKQDELQKIVDSLSECAIGLFDIFAGALTDTFNSPVASADAAGDATAGSSRGKNREINRIAAKLQPYFEAASDNGSSQDLRNDGLQWLQRQANRDLKRLGQIVNQRTSLNQRTAKAIQMSEALAHLALDSTRGIRNLRHRTVFTCLGDRMKIRLLPYHQAALLGVKRPSSTNYDFKTNELEPIEFTVIPHEVGHVLYRFGRLVDGDKKGFVHEQLKDLLEERGVVKTSKRDRRFRWLEEIFADAFGCLVAGPVSVLGFQHLLDNKQLQCDHGAIGNHPYDHLRPLLQSQILRKIDMPYHNRAADLLDDRWRKKANIEEADQKILDELEPVIEAVLETLGKTRPSTWTPDWRPEDGQTDPLVTLQKSFHTFANSLEKDVQIGSSQDENKEVETARQLRILFRQIRNDTADEVDMSCALDHIFEMLFDCWTDEGGGKAGMGGG